MITPFQSFAEAGDRARSFSGKDSRVSARNAPSIVGLDVGNAGACHGQLTPSSQTFTQDSSRSFDIIFETQVRQW